MKNGSGKKAKNSITTSTVMDEKKDSNFSCLEPQPTPILGTHDLSRILNVGFMKCGSSSINDLFKYSGFKTSHWSCGRSKKEGKFIQHGGCAQCMEKQMNMLGENVTNGTGILSNCGNHTVFTQMDFISFVKKNQTDHKCIFPQIQYLNELYHDSPHATWILPFRNVTKWIESITHYHFMRKRMSKFCNFPELGFHNEKNKKKTDEDFVNVVCNHVKQIRQFVNEHPTLSLVEFSIEDPNAGKFLASVFPGVNGTAWGHANNFEEIMKDGSGKKAKGTRPRI